MLNPIETETERRKPKARPQTDPPGLRTDGFSFDAIPDEGMQRAAEAVWSTWSNERGDAVDAEEAHTILVRVGTFVADALSGQVVPVSPLPGSILAGRFLELLRSQILDQWSDAIEPQRDLLEVMRAHEAVRNAIEPDWSGYFSSRLTGPDGLDLVVQLAHDLRSPLTSILFLAETLQRGQSGDVNEVQHRQLGLVYGAALGLSSIASDVIELARGGDRLVDDKPTAFSVGEVLESVQDIVRPIAAEKGLTISIVPPSSDIRLGHPLALSRVLLNLTTNALKFTDEGFVELGVKAAGMTKAEFSVRDSGDGINPAAMDSLYQPFRRAHGRDGYCFSGTGLGLAICRRLVAAMGSELQLETRPDWGTRFFFTLDLPPVSS